MKPFTFLAVRLPLKRLARRCRCQSKHVKVEAAYTKASATYTPQLSWELACALFIAMKAKDRLRDIDEEIQVTGLENQLVNQTAQCEKWEPLYAWTFKKKSHINILELSSVLRLVVHLAKEGGHCRGCSHPEQDRSCSGRLWSLHHGTLRPDQTQWCRRSHARRSLEGRKSGPILTHDEDELYDRAAAWTLQVGSELGKTCPPSWRPSPTQTSGPVSLQAS